MIEMIYWVCLTVGFIYTFAVLMMGGIAEFSGHGMDFGGSHGDFSHDYGVGGHGHGETSGSDTGGHVVFTPFSPLVIAFFLTCFGAMGLILMKLNRFELYLTIPLAAVGGVVLAWLLAMFFNKVFGNSQGSSEIRIGSLLGSEAEVTVAIPAAGVGEIAYVAMGSRNVAPARSDDQVAIPRFSTVRISRIVGNFFYVRPVVEEQMQKLERESPVSPSSTD